MLKRYGEFQRPKDMPYIIKPFTHEHKINLSKARKLYFEKLVTYDKKKKQSYRNGKEYSQWRDSVLKRDNYTCVLCHERSISIHSDHIKSFALYPKNRFNINDGRTLCYRCQLLCYIWKNYSI